MKQDRGDLCFYTRLKSFHADAIQCVLSFPSCIPLKKTADDVDAFDFSFRDRNTLLSNFDKTHVHHQWDFHFGNCIENAMIPSDRFADEFLKGVRDIVNRSPLSNKIFVPVGPMESSTLLVGTMPKLKLDGKPQLACDAIQHLLLRDSLPPLLESSIYTNFSFFMDQISPIYWPVSLSLQNILVYGKWEILLKYINHCLVSSLSKDDLWTPERLEVAALHGIGDYEIIKNQLAITERVVRELPMRSTKQAKRAHDLRLLVLHIAAALSSLDTVNAAPAENCQSYGEVLRLADWLLVLMMQPKGCSVDLRDIEALVEQWAPLILVELVGSVVPATGARARRTATSDSRIGSKYESAINDVIDIVCEGQVPQCGRICELLAMLEIAFVEASDRRLVGYSSKKLTTMYHFQQDLLAANDTVTLSDLTALLCAITQLPELRSRFHFHHINSLRRIHHDYNLSEDFLTYCSTAFWHHDKSHTIENVVQDPEDHPLKQYINECVASRLDIDDNGILILAGNGHVPVGVDAMELSSSRLQDLVFLVRAKLWTDAFVDENFFQDLTEALGNAAVACPEAMLHVTACTDKATQLRQHACDVKAGKASVLEKCGSPEAMNRNMVEDIDVFFQSLGSLVSLLHKANKKEALGGLSRLEARSQPTVADAYMSLGSQKKPTLMEIDCTSTAIDAARSAVDAIPRLANVLRPDVKLMCKVLRERMIQGDLTGEGSLPKSLFPLYLVQTTYDMYRGKREKIPSMLDYLWAEDKNWKKQYQIGEKNHLAALSTYQSKMKANEAAKMRKASLKLNHNAQVAPKKTETGSVLTADSAERGSITSPSTVASATLTKTQKSKRRKTPRENRSLRHPTFNEVKQTLSVSGASSHSASESITNPPTSPTSAESPSGKESNTSDECSIKEICDDIAPSLQPVKISREGMKLIRLESGATTTCLAPCSDIDYDWLL
ncbi:MAG: uncharacterized protein KVP18_003251 [Porospora cf. gigantea A]|nr:MAG: hypothetical protein KVP18_003251 [Porospora cf. gigantea A]